MSAPQRTLPTNRTETFRVRARRFKQPGLLAAASLAAIAISGCGGGDGSASSADGAQASGSTSQFRSFVSENPQVRAAIAAEPPTARPIKTKADTESASEDQAAERAAEESETPQDSSSSDSSSTDSSSSDSDSSDSDSSGSDSADSDSADSDSSNGNAQNVVDTMISDMSELNDLPLKGVNPSYGFSRGPGYVLFGNNSKGANFILPWFVQYEGEGNSAWNTRVQMRNLRAFVKSRSTGEWTTLSDSDSFEGIQCDQGGNHYHCPLQAEVRDGASEGASSLPLSNLNLHGWWGSREPIDGWDIAAIVVALEARLIVDTDNDVDDRSNAKYLVHVGADYYPEDAPPDLGLDPVGVSRAKLVTNEWQLFVMSTLDDVGAQEPGGGISSDELRSNPPPL